jgi:hypothetical protein
VRIGGLDEHDPAAMRMLVDTGADCADPARIAKTLRCLIDKIEIMGVGGRRCSRRCTRRACDSALRAIARLVALGDESLLGRDLLNRLILRIDGPGQIIETAPRKRRGADGRSPALTSVSAQPDTSSLRLSHNGVGGHRVACRLL